MLRNAQERLASRLDRQIEGANERIQQFKKRLDTNPTYALAWADDALAAAAQLEVLTIIKGEIIASLLAQGTRTMLIQYLDNAANQSVREGLKASSTSQMHNLMDKHRGEAWIDYWKDDRFGSGYRSLLTKDAL